MFLASEDIRKLKLKAAEIRLEIVRMIYNANSGHPGGSLSATDIMTYLYYKEMRVFPKRPRDERRDIFILSKGHACPALYTILAYKGFFSKDELHTLRRISSRFQGHPDMRMLPGVEMSTGSLGQGLAIAAGVALGSRLDNSSRRVYVLMGDGEQQEGMVWEAAMSAAHYKLDNLCAVLDYNGLQIDGKVKNVMDIASVTEKYKAFGWHTIEIDGHDFEAIAKAFEKARQIKGKPTIIIAHTVKGRGVSVMQNVVRFHGTAPNADEYKIAIDELTQELKKWQK